MREILADTDFTEPGAPVDFLQRMASYSEAYYREGVVRIPRALDAENLAIMRKLFDWSRAHPSPSGWNPDMQGTGETAFIDTHNRDARSHYNDILRKSSIPAIAAAVLDVGRLWFLGEQVFIKKGRRGSSATPWHQDSDLMLDAVGAVGMWMAFEPLDAQSGLSFIRGSHRGPCFNPLVSAKDEEPRFLYPKNMDLEPFPDIDADQDKFDMVTFAVEPGDVILFHHLTIHGGAPVPPSGERNTLCLRFVGPDTLYDDRREREPNGNVGVEATQYLWEGLMRDMPVHHGMHFSQVYDGAVAPAA